MNDLEKNPSLIVECPHCHTRVIPKTINTCPNCGEDVSDLNNVDPNRTAFTLLESEEYPPYCYSCNRYTERLIRVSADEDSVIEKLIFRNRPPESTTNVIIILPECESCSELEIELVDVNYEFQRMTIMVHQGFQERVLRYRESPSKLSDEGFDEAL